MTRDEFNKLYNKVKNEYKDFSGDYNEWYSVLIDYSYIDILTRLDERNSTTAPIHTTLIKNLKKEEKIDDWVTECDYCKTKIKIVNNDMTNFYKHYRKCQKIDFIDRMSQRIKGHGISSVVYYQMTDEELENDYRKIMSYYLQQKNVQRD